MHYIWYITIKIISNYNCIDRANPLYFIISQVDSYIERKNGKKYLTFISTDKSKQELTKYTKLWNWIKSLIYKIDDKTGKYGKDFMRSSSIQMITCLYTKYYSFIC